MAYEPVLAPTGVTGDSTLTSGEESGFRHYLKTISTLASPTTIPTKKSTNTIVSNLVFIIPKHKVVNDQVYASVDKANWGHPGQIERSSVDTTSLTEFSSNMAVTAASAALTTTTLTPNTESGFQEGGLSFSTFSSPIDSPSSTPTENVEDEVEVPNKHLAQPTTYQSRSQINLQPRGGQVISSWFQRIFRKRDSLVPPKTPENPATLNGLNRITDIPSSESLAKDISSPHAEEQLQGKAIEMRSTEVSSSDSHDILNEINESTVYWTESVTKICDLASTKTILHTIYLQTTCGEADHMCSPSQMASNSPPILLRIGKVETTSSREFHSPLDQSHNYALEGQANASQTFKVDNTDTRLTSSLITVFSSHIQAPSRLVNLVNKSTSPLTIIPGFRESPLDYMEQGGSLKRQPREPSYWCREDPDPTRLSTQTDLESDSSFQPLDDSLVIESEDLYEPVCQKTTCLASQNGKPQRSPQSSPVCIAKRQSEGPCNSGSSSVNNNSSVECDEKQANLRFGNDIPFREDEENSVNWLPLTKKSVIQIPLSSISKSRGEIVGDLPIEECNNVKLKASSTLERNGIKQRNNTPPPAILRRNRDIANGIQSPLSPCTIGFRTRRIISVVEHPTTPQINDNNLPLSPNGSVLFNGSEGLMNSGERLSLVNGTDQINNVAQPIAPKVVPTVHAVNEIALENKVDISPEARNKINTNSVEEEDKSDSEISELDDRIINVTTPQVSIKQADHHLLLSSDNISQNYCILPNSAQKTIANAQPSPVNRCQHYLEADEIQNSLLDKLWTSSEQSMINGKMTVQPNKRLEDAELRFPKGTVSPKVSDDLSIDKQDFLEAPRDAEVVDNNSTRSSIISVSIGSENGSIQIVSPTISRPQNLEVAGLTEMSPIETESALNIAPENDSILVSPLQSMAISSAIHAMTKVLDPDKTPIPADSYTPESDKTPVARTNEQKTPTSPTNQHFFPRTHQLPQSSAGVVAGARTENEVENKAMDASLLLNGVEEVNEKTDSTPKPTPKVKSTKITRGSHVTKRPQTVSVSRIHTLSENEQYDFVVHPETHRNIKPEEHFKLYEKVGGGKFGSVSRCENKQTHQIMAMKAIKMDRLPRHTNGDIMEVAVLRAIGRHENIACFFSAYEVSHTCYIITEYVGGGALYDRVVAEDNLDEKISASIIRQMLLGLQHIQACSVLHLDLKPENVMMVKPSGYQLKIIDFGMAYFYDPKRPRRQMGGTYIYSAPETINYEYQSFATDIWSVAVIAYELLSGITPFECPQSGNPERELTMPEITTNIINCRYNFDDDGICDASEKAKDFIRLILKKNPKDRLTVKECLEQPWMQMSDELPTIRRAVSIRRRASALEKTRPYGNGRFRITTDNAVF